MFRKDVDGLITLLEKKKCISCEVSSDNFRNPEIKNTFF